VARKSLLGKDLRRNCDTRSRVGPGVQAVPCVSTNILRRANLSGRIQGNGANNGENPIMIIDPQQIELSPEMKQAIAQKSAQTGRPWDEVLWEAIGQSPLPAPRRPNEGGSFYDAMHDLIGIVKEAPADLSTNPRYLEGFGCDHPNSSD
jgi:hypothetical protein